MIRHAVFFRFRADAGREARSEMLAAMGRLPSQFPTMRRFALAPNLSTRDSTYSHAMFVDFDDWDDLASYLGHAAHEQFVTEWFQPLVAGRVIASIES